MRGVQPAGAGYLLCITCLTLASGQIAAQADSSLQRADAPSGDRFTHGWWVVAGAAAASALADQRISAFTSAHQQPGLDAVARVIDPFGRARFIVPALAVSVVVPRVAGKRAVSDAMLRVALAYAAADGAESILKPLVGRHRPQDGNGPWRFHPASRKEEWHSFPSAHTVHSFALATGLAFESGDRRVAIPSYGIATLVGLQRVYTGAHWTSDAVGSAALAVGVASATIRLLRRRGLGAVLQPTSRGLARVEDDGAKSAEGDEPRLRLGLTVRSLAVSWTF
jgi:undecaprenyl-diphosphatase